MDQKGKVHFNLNLSTLEGTSLKKQSEMGREVTLKKSIVTLQPIAMRIPNSHGVYSPSKLRAKKEISYTEFLQKYAEHSREIRVCFDEIPVPDTLLQQSVLVTAYSFGWSGWHIIDPAKDPLT